MGIADPMVMRSYQLRGIAGMVDDIDITQQSPPPDGCARSPVQSLPSDFELDSIRKSSAPVIERRKTLQTYVASAVGVAWFICLFAMGQTALRSIVISMHH